MIAYTYVITNLLTGLRYYGARYAMGCSPDDLWVTYFTSSKVIHSLIKSDGIENWNIEIRRIFNSVEACISWEHKVLRRLKIPHNPLWYNQSVSGEKFFLRGDAKKRHAEIVSLAARKQWEDPKYREKMQELHRNRWSIAENREIHSQKIKDKWTDAAWREKIIQDRKNRCNTVEVRQKRSDTAIANWTRADYRENHRKAMMKVRQDPNWLAQNKEHMRAAWQDPIKRQRMLENRPEASAELRQLRSQNASRSNNSIWQDPEKRAKRIEAIRAGIQRRKIQRMGPPSAG